MSNLSDRVSYLKGLAEGLGIGKEDAGLHKLVMAIIDTLDETAQAIQQLNDNHQELDEYVESIDDDLAEIEEALFGDDDDEDDDDDDDDDLIECECPHCANIIYFDGESFDLADDNKCPNCGNSLFDEDLLSEDEDDE